MLEVIKTGLWFMMRPSHWAHALALMWRKCEASRDTPQLREAAGAWAAEQVVPVSTALKKIGLLNNGGTVPSLPAGLIEEAKRRAQTACVKMGGPGDIDLLFAAALLCGATRVVETGVAYGWSSLAILAALENNPVAKLVSVDMPYPKMNNEAWVGVAIPERLRNQWHLIREPDRNGLKKAIELHGGTIDLCHYDSDKSYQGRQFAYSLLWNALRQGGVFISDDIQDNFSFREFVETNDVIFAVTEYMGKYVGIIKK